MGQFVKTVHVSLESFHVGENDDEVKAKKRPESWKEMSSVMNYRGRFSRSIY